MNMMNTETELGNHIRTAMFEKRLNVRDAADIIGISTTTLSDIRTGKRTPSALTLTLIADKLDLDHDELFRLAGYLPDDSTTARDHLTDRCMMLYKKLSPEQQGWVLKILEGLTA